MTPLPIIRDEGRAAVFRKSARIDSVLGGDVEHERVSVDLVHLGNVPLHVLPIGARENRPAGDFGVPHAHVDDALHGSRGARSYGRAGFATLQAYLRSGEKS